MVWDFAAIGDESSAGVYEVTAEKIAHFCRQARYENLVYTSEPAAREAGFPGIIAPPGMVFVYAPVRLSELISDRVPAGPGPKPGALTTARVDINCQGTLVTPGDVITSVTSVQEKFQEGEDRFLTLRVTGVNQRNELVADYCWTYRWSDVMAAEEPDH